MWLPTPVCVHEAAHGTVATIYGFRINRIVVRPVLSALPCPYTALEWPYPSVALYQEDPELAFIRAVIVLQAGAQAETTYLGTREPGCDAGDAEILAGWVTTYTARYGVPWVEQQVRESQATLAAMLHDPLVRWGILRLGRCLQASSGTLYAFEIEQVLGSIREDFIARAEAKIAAFEARERADRQRRSDRALQAQYRLR